MKPVGITETYDPCFVDDWETRLLKANIIISKELNDEMVAKLVAVQGNVIFHHTVTGQGGTALEPGVQAPETEFQQFVKLLDSGFCPSHYVLRLDPIVLINAETQENISRVLELWSPMASKFPDSKIRCRISIVDMYRHARDRIRNAGIDIFYDQFRAPDAVFRRAEKILSAHTETFRFECCAEPSLDFPGLVHCGCASIEDIRILGLDPGEYGKPEKKQRNDCMCILKKQILGRKPGQCPHRCLYCFWK